MISKSMIGRSIILPAAAVALSAFVAKAQPKRDIGYDPHANAFEQLEAAVANAEAEDKLLLLISGGDWCKWCHYLRSRQVRGVHRPVAPRRLASLVI